MPSAASSNATAANAISARVVSFCSASCLSIPIFCAAAIRYRAAADRLATTVSARRSAGSVLLGSFARSHEKLTQMPAMAHWA